MWLLLLALGWTPQASSLHDAVRAGDLAAVRALLDAGGDVNAGNRYETTALFVACDKGDLEMVRLLVERGARVDVEDSFYRMTPMVRALGGGHPEVAELLLAHGAPGADDALQFATQSGRASLAKAAMATGAVTREAYDGALDEARASGASDIVALLEAAPRPTGRAEAEVTLSIEALQRLVGRYQNDAEQRVLSIALKEGGLELEGGPAGRLKATGESSFRLADSSMELTFSGRGGMVENLVLRNGEDATAFRPMDESESRERAPAEDADVISTRPTERAERRPAAPWPAFRGPNRSGVADGQGVPLEWRAETGKNIRFKTELPGFSVASPIIWGDRIFVVTAVSGAGDTTFRTGQYGDVAPVDDLSEHRWLLYALDTEDGRVVWENELDRGPPHTKRHTKSSQANATPVTDGEHIVTVLGAIGKIYCHDISGRLLWTKDIGVRNVGWFYDVDYQWGHSSSPILYEGKLILQSDAHNGSFIAAYRVSDGEELWRTSRDEEIPTFSTPAIYRGRDHDELITNGTTIRGYDPATGVLLWHLGPNSEIPIGAPVVTEDLIYVTAGYPPIRPIYAIRPGSRGDLALPEGVDRSEALAWSKDRGGTYIPSPLVYRGYFYTNANNGRLTCYDAATGELVYRARIGGVGGSYSASPIASDGRLYFTNEDGETFVVLAGPKYELLAKNSVDGPVLSTPAASDGLLVIRTLSHVFGISE